MKEFVKKLKELEGKLLQLAQLFPIEINSVNNTARTIDKIYSIVKGELAQYANCSR